MRRIFLVYLWFIGIGALYAQGDEFYGNENTNLYQQTELLTNPTVQAPDVAAFQKVNFIPVSNYTGRAQISIPIFTIKSGNISVPISLSYNSGGVKVNDIPSSVGTNWSLNAGGVVSKIVKGMEDFEASRNCNIQYDYERYCSTPGYFGSHSYPLWEEKDPFPDIYIASAPGLSTQYTHKTLTEVIEFTGQQNIITATYGQFTTGSYNVRRQVLGSNDYEYYDGSFNTSTQLNGFKDIKITNTSGLTYDFIHKDVSQYSFTEKTKKLSSGITYNPTEVISNLKVESYHLSKITDIKSNKEVTFTYETYKRATYDPVDNGYFYTGSTSNFQMDGVTEGKSTKYPVLNRLTKISYDGGSVEFIYGLNRQDVTDEKALTQIIIKDLNDVIIKKVNLQYGYMTNSGYAASAQNKRLRLDKVFTVNAQDQALPGYTLTYNTTPLPPRGAWGKDFLGYHNGSHSTSLTNPKPNIYFYPDKGTESFLPQSIGGNYYLISGQYSLASNLTYSKAGTLTKIQYPTGGFSELEYELNQFKIQNATITGGGLRIKTQKIKDELGNEQILDYQYLETDSSSSGRMVALPNYVDFRVNNTYSTTITPSSALSYFSFKTFRTPQTQAEFTNNSFVGYDRVVVKNRINNGYSVYNYSSPKSFPNLMHDNVISPYNTAATTYANSSIQGVAKRNGLRSSTLDREIYRGKLISEAVFDKSNVKIKETNNTYTYKKLDGFSIYNTLRLSGNRGYYSTQIYDGPFMTENVKYNVERYLLTKSVTTDYLDGGSTSVTKEITYDANRPLITENKITDPTKTIINKFYYPHNSQVSSQSFISNLRSQNRYAEMIMQEAYHDGTKIFTENIVYRDFGNGLYLPEEILTAKGTNILERGAEILRRDANGNILEYKTRDNVSTCFIYGYNNTQLIAKIENASYHEVTDNLPVPVSQLQGLDSPATEHTLMEYSDALRNNLPNARVASYTYIPSVGVSTITDNRGRTVYYEYDSFNRLHMVKDHEGYVLKKHQYNYKNQ